MDELERDETYPYKDNYPFRNIKATELKGGVGWDWEWKRTWSRNMNPIFDKDSKYWDLIKVLKSTTKVVHWLIKMHHNYYVVSQHKLFQIGEVCSIFEANKKGQYDSLNPIVIYNRYLDLESACDRFAQEYMAMLINERHPDVEFLTSKVDGTQTDGTV